MEAAAGTALAPQHALVLQCAPGRAHTLYTLLAARSSIESTSSVSCGSSYHGCSPCSARPCVSCSTYEHHAVEQVALSLRRVLGLCWRLVASLVQGRDGMLAHVWVRGATYPEFPVRASAPPPVLSPARPAHEESRAQGRRARGGGCVSHGPGSPPQPQLVHRRPTPGAAVWYQMSSPHCVSRATYDARMARRTPTACSSACSVRCRASTSAGGIRCGGGKFPSHGPSGMSAAPPGVGVAPPMDAEENERFSSLALFLVLFLLIGSFLTSYYLKVKRITAVHETIVGLFAGTSCD